MKKTFITVLAISTFIACTKREDTKASEPKNETSTASIVIPDSTTINKAWMNYATPGEAHKRMAEDAGVWDEEVISWQHAGAEPYKHKMTAEIKMIFEGKYQEAVHKGDFGGMNFEGKSTLAFDNTTKKYVSTWIDNMSTGIMIMKGDFDPKTNTYNFEGECEDVVTKKKKKVREVFTLIDKNTQKLEMFDTGYDGKEFKNMEIVMKRKVK